MAVSGAYEIDGSDLLLSRRGTAYEARDVAIRLCRYLSGETPARIGAESRSRQLRQCESRRVSHEEETGLPAGEKTNKEAGAAIEKDSKLDLPRLARPTWIVPTDEGVTLPFSVGKDTSPLT